MTSNMIKGLPRSFYNPITIAGALLATGAFGLIVFLFLVETFAKQSHPYMGMITFIILPMFLLFGLFVAVVGIARTRKRLKAGTDEGWAPRVIDLTDSKQRRAVILISSLSFVLLVASAFGSYQAYEYTDSVEFCGKVCHAVMKPEYVAYKNSPHAQVACADCHIGPGADWFIKSKISGSYQVYSVIFKKYHRPIETPIHNLRPAHETCERCHWPKHFYSAKLQSKSYFLSDDKNSRVDMNLLVKIGGGDLGHGASEGIHYHMYVANKISYVARDKQRLDIPYVESRDATGKLTVYQSTETPMAPADVAKGEKRTVDCIECHNRPTHRFRHPSDTVNQAMANGVISPTLPGVKKLAVDTLEAKYETEDGAVAAIRRTVEAYYKTQHPDIAAARVVDIDRAIQELQRIYKVNYFPEMRVSWKGHDDHIGHLYSPGCFRCHDGKHVSKEGKTLTNACDACHTILSEQKGNAAPAVALKGIEFQHPGDVGDSWKMMKCSDCHGAQAQQ